jgi:hypothetical protein
MQPSDDQTPGRTVLVALAAMAGVAVLVGLVVGLVLLVAVKVTGMGSSSASADEAPQSLYLPSYSPTRSPSDEESELASPSPSESEPTSSPDADRITLFVAPQRVAPGERIDFSGVYETGEGATLQIQRKEGAGWTDFPVTTVVRGGDFETYIETTHTGRTLFRVRDEAADRTSNVVVVTVG